MEILEWLEKWYLKHCDGVWENDHGIDIQTLDNPGWQINIELHGTPYANIEREWEAVQIDDNNWYGFKFELAVFDGIGDPTKLAVLIGEFRKIIEESE